MTTTNETIASHTQQTQSQSPSFTHQRPDRTGILFVNLGTPDAPTAPALKRYLREFLSDPRIVEAPRWLWWLLLRLVILPRRSGRSAAAYHEVWTERGSPLAYLSQDLTAGVAEKLDVGQVEVALAMRYGKPSVADTLDLLAEKQVRRLLVVPMYPQYSATTTASIFDAVTAHLQRRRWIPELRFINEYYATEAWLDAMAGHIAKHRSQLQPAERFLFSFHGIPLRYFEAGDPYYCQCQASARLLAQRLELRPDEYAVCFQSRFGREEWLQPYTDKTLEAWGREGVKSVQVVCPGFAVDCLETLEEIAGENRELFQAAGGERLDYIPALNAGPEHAEAMYQIVMPHLAGWPLAVDKAAAEKRDERARALATKTHYRLPEAG